MWSMTATGVGSTPYVNAEIDAHVVAEGDRGQRLAQPALAVHSDRLVGDVPGLRAARR